MNINFKLSKLTIAIFSFIAILLFSYSSNALQSARPIATDNRIKVFRYSSNEVYKFVGNYGYQTAIQFEDGEEILTVSVGNSVAWIFNKVGSKLFLKPIEDIALTNMTVVTNKRQYYFELHAQEVEKITDKRLTFVYRFIYPEKYGAGFANIVDNSEDELPDLQDKEVVSKLNFRYSIRGSSKISPLRIFDDGEYTFFQFPKINADVPAFYLVDSVGSEALINFKTIGDYIVVERVTARFTLRHGSDVACVYNETRKLDPKPIAVDERTFFGKVADFFSF